MLRLLMAAWSDGPAQEATNAASPRCVECRGAPSHGRARGWRGYRWDEPYTDDPPAIAFHCPGCAEREFGG
jgi:hypothetical protein